MTLTGKITRLFNKEFPKEIKEVYAYYEMRKKDSKFCVDLWKKIDWGVGGIVPMFKKDNKVAFYRITKAYYSQGTSSMSDWALGDDGRYRDFTFDHTELLKQ